MKTIFRVLHQAIVGVVGVSMTVLAAFGQTKDSSVPPRVSDLRCEMMRNPLGVDSPRPRLFWKLSLPTAEHRGTRQTAYQVLAASTPELLAGGKGDLWDSGRVDSEQSVYVPYQGRELRSREECWWKVRIWDERGQTSDWSKPAHWRTGILRPADWTGEWIASDLELKDYQKTLRELPDFGMQPETEIWEQAEKCREMTKDVKEAPAVYFRKEFRAKGELRRAVATVCGLGLHELSLNGQQVEERLLEPAYTDYERRVLYTTFDVTDTLTSGTNCVGVVLGNGWFNLITPHALRYYAADYIAPPRLRMEIELEYVDGSRETVKSGPDWKFTTEGPIRFNCVLAGETYDARREMPGWDRAGFDDSAWKSERAAEGPKGEMRSSALFPPVVRLARLEATTVTRNGEAWRFDLGEEAAGWARLQVRGRPGQEITIVYPGAPNHTLGRYQTSKYVCRGGSEGEEVYEPRFCYNGFRFVDVTGLDYEPKPSDLEGIVVGTQLEPAGSFSCSDERLNRLQEVVLRTIRNYVMHIPCDPTREKSGWTQDVQADFHPFAYNFQVAPTFAKWQRDFLDAVQANGYMPPVVPGRFDGPTINGPWWGGVVVYAPWYLYQFHGDRWILEESYPAMQRYLGYLDSISTAGIVEWGLGDWMEVGSVRPVRTPVAFTSTAAYCWFTDILAQTAAILGKGEDAARYGKRASELRMAFNKMFFNPETGVYAKGSQTSQLLPLCLNLAPPAKRDLVLRRLEDAIAGDKGHLSTGFVGTPFLLTGLAELGRPDLACTIATQTDYPSFIDAILNQGHSVMKEDWKGGLVQMPTLQGPIGTWFYHTLGGIRTDAEGPGFRKLVLKPEVGCGLTWVKAQHETLYGGVVSEWRRDGERLTWEVTVPPNTKARIYVPSAEGTEVKEGERNAEGGDGLKSAGREGKFAVFAAEPGRYRFESQVRP